MRRVHLCRFVVFRLMETRLEVLRRRKAELDERIKAVSRELGDFLRSQQSERARASRAWKLTERLRRVALIAYVLADYTPEPAVVFLRNAGGARGWPDVSDDELAFMVEQLFLEADVDDIAALSDESDPLDCHAVRVAARYAREWRLVVWGRRLNDECGIAPSVRMLVDKAYELGVSSSSGVSPKPIGRAVGGAAKAWARKFRIRWDARYGSVKAQEVVPVEEMRTKVNVYL